MNLILKYKRSIGPFFLVLYLLSSFKIISPYVNYNLNQEFIINVLCENRDKVELNCEGKCFLSKELKKAAEGKGEVSLNFNIHLEFLNAEANTQAIFPPSVDIIQHKRFQDGTWNNISSDKESPPPKA